MSGDHLFVISIKIKTYIDCYKSAYALPFSICFVYESLSLRNNKIKSKLYWVLWEHFLELIILFKSTSFYTTLKQTFWKRTPNINLLKKRNYRSQSYRFHPKIKLNCRWNIKHFPFIYLCSSIKRKFHFNWNDLIEKVLLFLLIRETDNWNESQRLIICHLQKLNADNVALFVSAVIFHWQKHFPEVMPKNSRSNSFHTYNQFENVQITVSSPKIKFIYFEWKC